MCFTCLMKLYVSVGIFAVGFLTICVLLFKVMNVKVQCLGHLQINHKIINIKKGIVNPLINT